MRTSRRASGVEHMSLEEEERKRKDVLDLSLPATEQLKDQYSQRPAVCRAVVALIQDDLRGHLGVSPLVQDDVLRLQVSVDDSSAVQEGQSLDHAASVEPSHAVIKRSSETHSELTLRKSWT
ncbi:hypothetical protein F7725_014964 [Dissostichus mawsoni]|uniref:Uncharacterized protein n=1 Tax=Dissostichus mawsoni TaxID=36200 RepID=A0A7J5YJ17_DISMA|nr:hypothetical protein F7725_014964 [Dissostichus mawsoni]